MRVWSRLRRGSLGRSARVWARPHSSSRVLRIGFADGLAAALELEPRRPCAPDGAVAGQAPPPGGRADQPTTNVSREDSVISSEVHSEFRGGSVVGRVDPDALVCAGCAEPAVGMPPVDWPANAGQAPEYSHRDGSVLCPDAAGRIGEPVEVGGLRYALTDAGVHALAADARAIADWAGLWS